jgi:serine/threonine protein kinase
MDDYPVTQLGKYHLIRHLAHGGMSDIYLARKEGHEQFYALKVVKPELAGNYQHFRREASILTTLKHEHILPIYDFEEADGMAYYVTPYIEQGSLKERLVNGPLSLEEAGDILKQVGDALHFIHELGLVHRDIKPANILLDETNYAWLADFGLAKEVNAPSDLTDSSCLLGTPYYIAPELLEKPATSSSDIYALGVVLYEMLTSTPPFTGQTPLMICWKHVYELPSRPSELNPAIPAAVEQVILRALEKEPAQRFASVREMVEAYQQALLAPTVVVKPQVLARSAALPALLEKTLIRTRPHSQRSSVNSQQRQRRPLAVAMLMLAALFFLSVTTLAIEYQIQPSATIKASAQMIALPTAHPTQHTVTPAPTAKPRPKTTPTHASHTGTVAAAPVQNGGPPAKHHKHDKKHHGDD